MKANCTLYPKVSLGLGFKNPTKEDSEIVRIQVRGLTKTEKSVD
jgi:hypothetical protein